MTIEQTVPETAHQLLAEGYRYIDVRTEGEFAGGHPAGAVNIPVIFADPVTRQMTVNPEFVAVVETHFPKDAPLIIGCQSGGRSQRAAEMLAGAGYRRVLNMQGGFGGLRDQSGRTVVAGWCECGLPVCDPCRPEHTYVGLRAAAGK